MVTILQQTMFVKDKFRERYDLGATITLALLEPGFRVSLFDLNGIQTVAERCSFIVTGLRRRCTGRLARFRPGHLVRMPSL